MWKFLVFSAVLGATLAAPDMRPIIVNGTDAAEGEFKFAVSLRVGQSHNCGATILNKRFILTAAHCVSDDSGRPLDPSYFTIQYGSVRISETDERSIPVKAIYSHDFDIDYLINDVAVLELQTDLPDDGSWEPVKLAKSYDTSVGSKGIAIGWGRLYHRGPIPTVLQKLEVDIYSNLVCGLRFDNKEHICFGASVGGYCHGDSGTCLLTLDNEQIGVASFITNTCGISSWLYPNVYAKIDYFYSWIESKIKI